MAFSKTWTKEGVKPKKAHELRQKPSDVKKELEKIASSEQGYKKDESDPYLGGAV